VSSWQRLSILEVDLGLAHLFGNVTDSGEGVCVDPGEREAVLGTRAPSPPERGKRQQLAPDSGGGET
jgi:hypothetical protein